MIRSVLLSCQSMSKSYGAQSLFRGLSFGLLEKDRVGLIGPNGSGKSTLLKILAGIEEPDSGTRSVRRLLRVGYVPQDVLLFPHLDVRKNVTYARERRATVDVPDLDQLLGLTTLMDRQVSGLSGGERQRVALARALYSGPDVLLLDEPLAAVDLARRRLILDVLIAIRDDLQVPLVYVTHSPEEARAIADYAIVLDDGKVVAAGTPGDVLP